MSDLAQVGGKNASLGEMINELAGQGVRVPGGFATTAFAFREFCQQRAQGFVVFDVGERGVVVAEGVDEGQVLRAVAHGGVDGDGLVGVAGDQALRHLLGVEVEFGGEFGDRRRTAELLRQLAHGAAQQQV